MLLSPPSPLAQVLTLWLPWSTHAGLISSLVTLDLDLERNSQRSCIWGVVVPWETEVSRALCGGWSWVGWGFNAMDTSFPEASALGQL